VGRLKIADNSTTTTKDLSNGLACFADKVLAYLGSVGVADKVSMELRLFEETTGYIKNQSK
jgi:hypothetical protein